MKKFLIEFLLALSLFVFIPSCGVNHKIQVTSNNTEVLSYGKMHYILDRDYCQYQVDSMIRVDKLSPLNDWIINKVDTDNRHITQYMFIKSLIKGNEMIYVTRQINADTVYHCTKRITTK